MARQNTGRLVLMCVALFVIVFLLAGAFMLMHKTFVDTWIVVAVVIFFILATAPLLPKWSRITRSGKWYVNGAVHVAVTATLAFFGFMALNAWATDASATETQTATVERKLRKKHDRYRRVSRRTRVKSGEYYTYHLDLKMPDGRNKIVEVPFDEYQGARKSSTADVEVYDGLFKLKVIKSVKPKIHRKSRKSQRLRYFGSRRKSLQS